MHHSYRFPHVSRILPLSDRFRPHLPSTSPHAHSLLPSRPHCPTPRIDSPLRHASHHSPRPQIVSDTPAAAAGVFTTNMMCAAPVTYCRNVLAKQKTARAVLTNAGQANAATGDQGMADAVRTADELAALLGISKDEILLMSTGVIGQRIKVGAST